MSLVDVERPTSAVSDRETPEVIDVDLLDVEDVVPIRYEPPARRRRVSETGRSVSVGREVITINDSDDDDIEFVSARTVPRPRRRIFSPSPPPQIAAIPPVPQIPQRFVPMRRRPPPFPTAPGPVVPNAEPLPFEANIRRVPRPTENLPAPAPPPAAASSHHVPVMGFGGALIQRARAAFDEPPSRSRSNEGHRRVFGVPAGIFMQWDPLNLFVDEEDLHGDDGFRHYRAADFHDQPLMRGDLRLLSNPGRPSEPDYKTEYTHSTKPPPGFTHDFELSSTSPMPVIEIDSPCSSSSSLNRPGDAVLACPRCHDPLVLGATDVAEERAKRRLWGLRCGHLIDGKCVEELMKPPPLVVPKAIDVKGKGKAEYVDEFPLPGAYPTHSLKGKGKATESEITPEPIFSSIRSRLRPRHPPPSLSSEPLPASPGPSRVRPRAPRTPLKGKGSGKGRAKVPIVEAEHEWTCPVGGCGRVHVSQLIGGQWVMDDKRGAIAVFV